jgi:hypothetical protein
VLCFVKGRATLRRPMARGTGWGRGWGSGACCNGIGSNQQRPWHWVMLALAVAASTSFTGTKARSLFEG